MQTNINQQDSNGETALIRALKANDTKLATKILQDNPDIDVNIQANDGMTALLWAATHSNHNIVRQLLERSDIQLNSADSQGQTALFKAISNTDETLVQLILSHKDTAPNWQDKNLLSVLMHAVNQRNKKIVEILLERGDININLQDKDGCTALFWAMKNYDTEIVPLLLAREELDINIIDNNPDNALTLFTSISHMLSEEYSLKIVNDIIKLLNKDSDINLQNKQGNSALMLATVKKFTAATTLFLRQPNIDVSLKNETGETALTLALKTIETLEEQDILNIKDIISRLNLDTDDLLDKPKEKKQLFNLIADNHTYLFLNFFNSELDPDKNLTKNIDVYLTTNPGNVVGKKHLHNKTTKEQILLITDRVIQNLTSNKIKLKYSQIVPYNVDIEILKKLMPFFEAPQKTVAVRDNPIILAGRAHDFPVIEYAYDHREEEPWATFWQQAGNEGNALLEYFFSPLRFIANPTKESEIFEYMLNNINIVKNINYQTISIATNTNIHKKKLLQKFSRQTLSSILFGNYENKISGWFDTLLDMQKVMKGITRHRKDVGQSAHDKETEEKAIAVSDKNFENELNDRYPGQDTLKAKKNLAMLDLRILVLKQLIENKETINSEFYPGWQKLINLLGLDGYSETTVDGKLRTFAEFKNIIFSTANNLVINSILNGTTPENCDQIILDNIKEIRSLLTLKHKDKLSLDPKVAQAWAAIDPQGITETQQNFSAEKVNDFVLFCMLLATQDIDLLVNNCNNLNDLMQLMSRSLAEKSDKVRRKLYAISNRTIENYTHDEFEALKQEVKECLLADQQLMGATTVTESVLALRENSCTTGILTRFADNVLGPHYKYSLLHAEDALLKDKVEEINKQMCIIFSNFLEQRVLGILLERLNTNILIKNQQSYKEMLFSSLNRRKENKNPIVAAANALYSHKTGPKSISELKEQLSKLAPDTQLEIIKTLFAVTDANQLKNYTAMGSDADIAKLFDALFSVNEDNWWELYINDCSIEKFSARASKTPDEITPEDKIKRDEFDTIYGRARLLTKCFDRDNIKQLILSALKKENPLRAPFSKAEIRAIYYYCTTITSPAQLQKIASNMLESINSIPKIMNDPEDQAKHYFQFINILEKSAAKLTKDQQLDIVTKNKLTNSLVTAILFECWRETHSTAKIDTFDQPEFIKLIQESDSDSYDHIFDFAKAACTALLKAEHDSLRAIMIDRKTSMPISDWISKLNLTDDERELRDTIMTIFQKQQSNKFKPR